VLPERQALITHRRAMAIVTLTLEPLLFGVATLIARNNRFALVMKPPPLWAAIIVLYPIFSVYPQETIYRAFLFRRYRWVVSCCHTDREEE
jgi:hypothetical protein